MDNVRGYDFHQFSAATARESLRMEGLASPRVSVGDFLLSDASPSYDAVVGNPPYVRYQGFQGDARAAGLRAALAQGVRLTHLASSWASFVVHAAAFLKPEGRLALVLPAELLSSNYAAEVRAFLLARFATVRVVLFDKHVFPGVQTEALLLLAEGTGGTVEVQFGRVERTSDLASLTFATRRPQSTRDRWSRALANPEATDVLNELTTEGVFSQLHAWGRISLGTVTGANAFFALSPARAKEIDLRPTDVLRISPPGSSHLRKVLRAQFQGLPGTGTKRSQDLAL